MNIYFLCGVLLGFIFGIGFVVLLLMSLFEKCAFKYTRYIPKDESKERK
jgi:hypothetical protein